MKIPPLRKPDSAVFSSQPVILKTALRKPGLWTASEGRLRRITHVAVNVKDGSILVRIPAGDFEMGDGRDGDCPKHRVELSEYWIGVYCVTNRQYAKFVLKTKHRAPDDCDVKDPGKADYPVTDVSWDDCAAYAEWAELSLPTEAQWEHTARGPGGLIYPWGDEWDRSQCLNSENWDDEPTAIVWGYQGGSAGYGTLQQAGNVSEWCADWYDSDYYGKSPTKDPEGPAGGRVRVYRGGDISYGEVTDFRGANRCLFYPESSSPFRGFRLVRNSPSVSESDKNRS